MFITEKKKKKMNGKERKNDSSICSSDNTISKKNDKDPTNCS